MPLPSEARAGVEQRHADLLGAARFVLCCPSASDRLCAARSGTWQAGQDTTSKCRAAFGSHLVRLQYAGVTAEQAAIRAFRQRSRLHLMRGVAAGADRCVAVFRLLSDLTVHAAEIGGEDIGVAFLARDLIDLLGRAFDDRMGIMTVGADRGSRIAATDQSGMDAVFPLLELVGWQPLQTGSCRPYSCARS